MSISNFNDIKIVIAGLDNAGKTSFLIALRHKYDFYERVKKLKPTIKVDYSSFEFLNWRVSLWDMGGQEKYRKIYLLRPEVYFSEADFLYFIIDLQDELKIEESVRYLHELLDVYREMDYQYEVVICFNKCDPEIKDNIEIKDRIEMLRKLIIIENKDITFKFFKTSIYDISSLSLAMSYSLDKLLKLEEINAKLGSFVTDHGCRYAILYTNKGLIIADHYGETMDARSFDEVISSKISEDLEFFQRLADEDVGIDGRLTYVDNYMENVKKYEVLLDGNKKYLFYLGVSAPPDTLKTINNEFEGFKEILDRTFNK